MKLKEILRLEHVFPDLQAQNREEALAELARGLAAELPISSDNLAQVLLEREKQAPTSMSGGVAVPHARLGQLSHFLMAVGRSRMGIDFGAEDGKTKIFFVLLSPASETTLHLKILARIARILRNHSLREDFEKAPDAAALFARIIHEDEVT